MYQVTYIREDWSAQYAIEELLPDDIDRIPCGTWNSVEDFLEGALPGTYEFDGPRLFTVVTGKPAE